MERSVRARPSDILSNLPDHVTEKILMYLPTPDAVRTSVLSKKWRYTWTKLPQLKLDFEFWKKCRARGSTRTKLASFMCNFQLLHEGPISMFSLRSIYLESCPELDSLVHFLSKKGVEDFTFLLRIEYEDSYKFPSSFFGCKELRHLKLGACRIGSPPEDFNGFRSLRTMKLHGVHVRCQVLENLISNSPLLEELSLRNSSLDEGEIKIEIDAPKLKTFTVFGYKKIILKNVTCLSSMKVFASSWEGVAFVKCFDNLSILEELCIFSLPEDLKADDVPRRLPTTLTYLKDVIVSNMTLGLVELSFFLCLIRSSPNLNRIGIRFGSSYNSNSVPEVLKEQDVSDVVLDELQVLELGFVNGTRPVLQFIKLLLAKSTSLRKIMIHGTEERVTELISKLLESQHPELAQAIQVT